MVVEGVKKDRQRSLHLLWYVARVEFFNRTIPLSPVVPMASFFVCWPVASCIGVCVSVCPCVTVCVSVRVSVCVCERAFELAGVKSISMEPPLNKYLFSSAP